MEHSVRNILYAEWVHIATSEMCSPDKISHSDKSVEITLFFYVDVEL